MPSTVQLISHSTIFITFCRRSAVGTCSGTSTKRADGSGCETSLNRSPPGSKETAIENLSSNERQRVYISLYQSHLPKLDNHGIVTYDKDRGWVEPTPLVARLRLSRAPASGPVIRTVAATVRGDNRPLWAASRDDRGGDRSGFRTRRCGTRSRRVCHRDGNTRVVDRRVPPIAPRRGRSDDTAPVFSERDSRATTVNRRGTVQSRSFHGTARGAGGRGTRPKSPAGWEARRRQPMVAAATIGVSLVT